jgi:2-polyprenyl-6-methoxyphenol hydroxylase-like FAD-dependent oxidoreductase
MAQPLVMIAGGGIGGLATALTLNQIGVPCLVFEPCANCVRSVSASTSSRMPCANCTISASDRTRWTRSGVPAKEWALVGLNGNDIYSETRGLLAGYGWPQYAVHRGLFHMLLANTFTARAGEDALRLGSRVTGYENNADGTVTAIVEHADGSTSRQTGTLLIGADGIHSSIRAQMHPDQPPIHWGGAIMWRGTTRAKPIRSGSSFVGLGTHKHRMVIYPISHPDPDGLATINWIAELTVDNSDGWSEAGWFRPVQKSEFAHHFDGFRYDWLDVPALLRGADVAYENPMIDRDPVPPGSTGGWP